jgi:hypothetical protein
MVLNDLYFVAEHMDLYLYRASGYPGQNEERKRHAKQRPSFRSNDAISQND